jgi:predicted ATPase/DNA-binding SARP family transcriptional activator
MPPSQTAPPPLTITLFGPMQVRVHGQPLPAFRSHKHQWVLALLSLRPNLPVQRDWLAGTLWPDRSQSQAFANLRPVLSELRRAMATEGRRLQSPNHHTLLLDLTDADVDLLQFDAALKSGTFAHLEQAVALYRGPLLEGCQEPWIEPERLAREQLYLQALKTLGEATLTDGRYQAAVDYYQRAVQTDPWQEAARRGWMEALAQSGDVNAALQVYREFLAFLKDDPKAVPDQQTRALYQRLRTQVQQRASRPVAVTAETVPVPPIQGFLPHPPTELVGRDQERQEVALHLRNARLVTLTGAGGIGKTRLARAVAGEVETEYRDGVWLVGLESLSEGRLVIQQIASVLGLREQPGRPLLQSVTEHLRGKRMLVVLDNCEHLLEASAQVAAHLLQECGEVRILATSREALGITGELVWSVPALAVPEMELMHPEQTPQVSVLLGYESVELFVERAQAVQTEFALSSSNAHLVAHTCRRLEGIPLAIELAAARTREMSVAQIASRLEDYLGLLAGGEPPVQSRQQTLRTTLDWSYDLLTEAERSLLKRLSVFAGGWDLEAAEQVCSDEDSLLSTSYCLLPAFEVLDVLTSLVTKSLVQFGERGVADRRYRLLEMVRQYAAEGLQASGEAEQIKTRHRDWFLALAEEAETQLKGAEQAKWLQRLEREHDNLRVALAWSATDALGAQAGLRMASALYRFWHLRGDFNEGRASLGRALEREEAQEATTARAKALNGAGALADLQGDYAAARTLTDEALTIQRALGDRGGIAISLNTLGNITYRQDNYEAAQAYYGESLAIRRELGDRQGIASSLTNLGMMASYQGDYVTARTLLQEGLALYREVKDKAFSTHTLDSLGDVALRQGDYLSARAYYEESVTIRRELGDKGGIARSLYRIGTIAYAQVDLDAAEACFEESFAINKELGDRSGIASSLVSLALIAYGRSDYVTAQTYLEEALVANREIGNRAWESISLDFLGNVARERGDYAAARAYHQEGLEISREIGYQPIITGALYGLGRLAHAQNDYASARAFYRESLEAGDRQNIVATVEAVAVLIATETTLTTEFRETAEPGQDIGIGLRPAVLLWGAAWAWRDQNGVPLPPAEQAECDRQLAQARSTLGKDAFAAAWEEGRAMTLEQAIEYALAH